MQKELEKAFENFTKFNKKIGFGDRLNNIGIDLKSASIATMACIIASIPELYHKAVNGENNKYIREILRVAQNVTKYINNNDPLGINKNMSDLQLMIQNSTMTIESLTNAIDSIKPSTNWINGIGAVTTVMTTAISAISLECMRQNNSKKYDLEYQLFNILPELSLKHKYVQHKINSVLTKQIFTEEKQYTSWLDITKHISQSFAVGLLGNGIEPIMDFIHQHNHKTQTTQSDDIELGPDPYNILPIGDNIDNIILSQKNKVKTIEAASIYTLLVGLVISYTGDVWQLPEKAQNIMNTIIFASFSLFPSSYAQSQFSAHERKHLEQMQLDVIKLSKCIAEKTELDGLTFERLKILFPALKNQFEELKSIVKVGNITEKQKAEQKKSFITKGALSFIQSFSFISSIVLFAIPEINGYPENPLIASAFPIGRGVASGIAQAIWPIYNIVNADNNNNKAYSSIDLSRGIVGNALGIIYTLGPLFISDSHKLMLFYRTLIATGLISDTTSNTLLNKYSAKQERNPIVESVISEIFDDIFFDKHNLSNQQKSHHMLALQKIIHAISIDDGLLYDMKNVNKQKIDGIKLPLDDVDQIKRDGILYKAITFVVNSECGIFQSDNTEEQIIVNKIIDLYKNHINYAKKKIESRNVAMF